MRTQGRGSRASFPGPGLRRERGMESGDGDTRRDGEAVFWLIAMLFVVGRVWSRTGWVLTVA